MTKKDQAAMQALRDALRAGRHKFEQAALHVLADLDAKIAAAEAEERA